MKKSRSYIKKLNHAGSMTDLVKRTYRVRKSHDKKIKRLSKRRSESQIVRDAIDLLPDPNVEGAKRPKNLEKARAKRHKTV